MKHATFGNGETAATSSKKSTTMHIHRKSLLWDKIVYLFIPVSFFILICYFFYQVNFTNWFEINDRNGVSQTHYNISFLLVFIFLVYSVLKIFRLTKFITIESTIPLNAKIFLIDQLKEVFVWQQIANKSDNEFEFLRNRMFKYHYRVTITITEKDFSLNVQDYYQYSILDFGINKRITKEIAFEIEQLIMTSAAANSLLEYQRL